MTERVEPVMVCDSCGRGFLRNPGSKIDPVPVWFTTDADSGGTCGGRIRMLNRYAQILRLDQQEDQNGQD